MEKINKNKWKNKGRRKIKEIKKRRTTEKKEMHIWKETQKKKKEKK